MSEDGSHSSCHHESCCRFGGPGKRRGGSCASFMRQRLHLSRLRSRMIQARGGGNTLCRRFHTVFILATGFDKSYVPWNMRNTQPYLMLCLQVARAQQTAWVLSGCLLMCTPTDTQRKKAIPTNISNRSQKFQEQVFPISHRPVFRMVGRMPLIQVKL